MSVLPHEKPIYDCQDTINQLKEQNKSNDIWSKDEITKLEKKLDFLKKKVYSSLTSWDRILISRHPQRPRSIDYLKNIFDEYEEISGDRLFRDDKSIITAFVKADGKKFIFIGQEKGNDTETRLYRNFGMPHPEGYRKALRAMKLAEKFSLPIICMLDAPGAYPGLAAEERGQGWAIAKNLFEMSRLKTQIIIVLIGEGCSGGALGIGIGDKIGMMEHAYYSVISPEGCASILFKDPNKSSIAAEALKIHAEHLKKIKVIDKIIKEPIGGAHLDPIIAYENVKNFILYAYEDLKNIALNTLIDKRYSKFRDIGEFTKQ